LHLEQARSPAPSRPGNADRQFSIGISVTRNRLFGVVVDLDGEIVESPVQAGRAVGRRRLADKDAETVMAGIAQLVEELQALSPDRRRVVGIGVSVGGHVNSHAGEVVLSPQLDWRMPVPLADRLSDATGFDIVVVENDVNALAVGAQYFGDATEPHFAVLNLGSGLGVGLVLNHELFRGASGVAGEFGHLPLMRRGERCSCGRRGCLETVVGGDAILRKMTKAGQPIKNVDAGIDLVRSGNETARRIFKEQGEALGRSLAGLINLLNLKLVILCATPPVLGCAPYMDAVHRSFRGHAFSTAASDCKLRPEYRTDELEARGAASLAFANEGEV
jgi:predicted NBD/HSP70 family sugar kinase